MHCLVKYLIKMLLYWVFFSFYLKTTIGFHLLWLETTDSPHNMDFIWTIMKKKLPFCYFLQKNALNHLFYFNFRVYKTNLLHGCGLCVTFVRIDAIFVTRRLLNPPWNQSYSKHLQLREVMFGRPHTGMHLKLCFLHIRISSSLNVTATFTYTHCIITQDDNTHM